MYVHTRSASGHAPPFVRDSVDGCGEREEGPSTEAALEADHVPDDVTAAGADGASGSVCSDPQK